MDRIGVIGTGVMAKGICFSLLANDYAVDVFTRRPADECLAEFTGKSRYYSLGLNKDIEPLMSALRFYSDEDIARGGEFIIECSTEDLDRKRKVLSRAGVALPNSVIVSNTSSISIEVLSRSVSKPERFAGMHFMNPPHLINFVEIIRCRTTSDSAIEAVWQVCARLGKECIVVPDIPGFIVNRLLLVQINEAFKLIHDNEIDPSSVETAMKKGAGWTIGPIKLAETIATDVCVRILENISEQTRSEAYRPAPLLRELVHAGILGAKNGTSIMKFLTSRKTSQNQAGKGLT